MNFKRFQIDNVNVPDDVLFMYGSRSVRSQIIHNLLSKYGISKGQIYTKTASDKEYYKGTLQGAYVCPGVKKDGVAYLFKKQIERIEKESDSILSRAFIIFDNCFTEVSDVEFIAQVCKNARKYNVLVVISCNRGEEIPDKLVKLCSCVMLTGNTNKYDRRELYETFGEIFKTDRIFYKCFDYLTEDENLMVICRDGSDDLQKQVFWYPVEGTARSKTDVNRDDINHDDKTITCNKNDTNIVSAMKNPNQNHKSETNDNTDETLNEQNKDDNNREERGECMIM